MQLLWEKRQKRSSVDLVVVDSRSGKVGQSKKRCHFALSPLGHDLVLQVVLVHPML